MPRSLKVTLGGFIVVVGLTASAIRATQERNAQQPPQDAAARMHQLGWLAGQWRGTFDEGEWEASYTTPHAGEILSSNKEIIDGRVNMIEFEHFRVENDAVVVTPYPFGRKASVSFTLRELSTVANTERAVFSNPEHDFPRQIVYRRQGADRLLVEVSGEMGGAPITVNIDLQRIEP